MMAASKNSKGLFCELDSGLAAAFQEAGFGFSGEGSQALFHPLEVGYLVKIGKATSESGSTSSFIAAQKKKGSIFPFALAVYFLIRATGRQIRPYAKGIKYFRVYAPGVGRLEERPSQLVCLLPGKIPSAKSLEEEVRIAHLARLDLIIACGAQMEIKFYKISSYNF